MPRVLMPKVTYSVCSILVSSQHTRVCWYNGFVCNYKCSIAVIKLQFSPICRPLASAAWCGPHPRTPLATPLLFSRLGLCGVTFRDHTHRVNRRHGNLWSQYNLHVVGQRGVGRGREFICHKIKKTYKIIVNMTTVAGYQRGNPIKLVA